MIEPLRIYRNAKENGYQPALLFGNKTILGIKPTRKLVVRNGELFENEKKIGPAHELISHLNMLCKAKQERSALRSVHNEQISKILQSAGTTYLSDFFPAWIGYFSYEFARHFGLPTKEPMPDMPEAAFYFYEDGMVWDGDSHPHPALSLPAGEGINTSLVAEFSKDQFLDACRQIQGQIRNGEVYQVNLSQRFRFDASQLDPIDIFSLLATSNPSPFMGLFEGPDWSIISGSPERLFDFADGQLSTRPIAGTRPRGASDALDLANQEELTSNRKELAEHTMLVDLLRNDLSVVCDPGSVYVSEAMTVERYSHVMHLVSEVRGRTNAAFGDILKAIFPGGTITGAPKEAAMQSIARFEPVPRGPYTGSLGYISQNGAMDFNILIRSMTIARGTGYLSAGAGIVIESDPINEYQEVQHKASSLKHVLGLQKQGQQPSPPQIFHSWHPPKVAPVKKTNVLFIECHDSFSHNIINYLRVLGANVQVIDHAIPSPASGRGQGEGGTHLIIGPGPGNPRTSGKILDWVGWALTNDIPLLGICLGHQALGVYCGAELTRSKRAIHGECHEIFHSNRGLFHNLPSPTRFARYHSLALINLPPQLECIAWSADREIMAIAHKEKAAWGVQFHPESFVSEHGQELLARFLDPNVQGSLPPPINASKSWIQSVRVE